MRIELTKTDTLMIGLTGAMIFFTWKAMKGSTTDKKKLKAHREEVLNNRDLAKEKTDASLKNELIEDAWLRADAMDVLTSMERKVLNASDIGSFDAALKEFDRFVIDLKSGTPESRSSAIQYERRKLELERQEEEIKRQNTNYRNNVDTIASAIRSLSVGRIDISNNIPEVILAKMNNM